MKQTIRAWSESDNNSSVWPESDFINLKERFSEICPSDIQMKPSDPFYGEDLIIFKDVYQGPTPLNGIKKREFDSIQTIYKKIEKGETFFRFVEKIR